VAVPQTGLFFNRKMPATIRPIANTGPNTTLVHYKIWNQKMPVDGKLLEILCCPVSKTPLVRLNQDKLDKLNSAIEADDALFIDAKKVTEPLQEGLITEDGKVIYAVQDSIPVLLEEQGIGTSQFQDF